MAAEIGNKYAEGNVNTYYRVEYNELAYNYCLLGATDADLAKFFDVAESTINNWKNEFPSFLESIKKGKELADIEVVKSLYKRALGYKYKEVTSKALKTPNNKDNFDDIDDEDYIADGDNGFENIQVTTKEVVPDTTAQIFWLKNRQPKLWRDKHELDVDVKDGFFKFLKETSNDGPEI